MRLYFWLLALACLTAHAQRTMIEEGRTWNCEDLYPSPPAGAEQAYFDESKSAYVVHCTYRLCGDTAIAGNTYKRMLRNGQYLCAMRQEGQRVTLVAEGETDEKLAFDFSLGQGSAVVQKTEATGYGIDVEAVDLVVVDGVARLRQMLYTDYGMLADIWVEGIGSMDGPLPYWRNGWTTPVHHFISCSQDGVQIFSASDFLVTQSVRKPYAGDSRTAPRQYSLHGHQVSGQPQRGVIRIINGRKIVKTP